MGKSLKGHGKVSKSLHWKGRGNVVGKSWKGCEKSSKGCGNPEVNMCMNPVSVIVSVVLLSFTVITHTHIHTHCGLGASETFSHNFSPRLERL